MRAIMTNNSEQLAKKIVDYLKDVYNPQGVIVPISVHNGIFRIVENFAPVAQSDEQLSSKQQVVGSNPIGSTSIYVTR